MFFLETPRLYLVETPVEVMEARLERDAFTARVPLGDPTRAELVAFPAEWPGEAVVMFPMLIARCRAGLPVPWGGIVVDRATRTAAGQMSFKARPDAAGTVEIGYGMNPSFQGRGLATEAASALVAWALARDDVRRVIAECLEGNHASARVLEKAGFHRTGERFDAVEGGRVLLWARSRGPGGA